MLDKNEIYYSMSGLPQYFNSISEMFAYRITEKTKKIVINTSSQPNSIPHLGTLTTLMCIFTLAKDLKKHYSIEVEVQFDEIECSPTIIEENGKRIVKAISDVYRNNESISNENMKYYIEVLDFLRDKTGINYTIRTYEEFQSNREIRAGLIKVVNDSEFFIKLFSPRDGKLHIRTKCPKCASIDKDMSFTKVIKVNNNSIYIQSECCTHGKYIVKICKTNKNFVEMNTQLRDLLKGYMISNGDPCVLIAMIDGGDWGGAWSLRIGAEGLFRLNKNTPIRLFTPLILDRSGGKLSKSHYLNGKSYSYVDKYYNNYLEFKNYFGLDGLNKLFHEVKLWLREPKKFFRNYSIDYINMIMNEKDEEQK